MATKRSTTEIGKVPCFTDDDVEAAALVVPEELKDGPLTDEPSSVSSGPMQSRLTSEAITTLNSRPSCSQASTAVKFPFVGTPAERANPQMAPIGRVRGIIDS